MTLHPRIAPYVRVTDSGCMEWTRTISTSGYGKLSLDSRIQHAHRAQYEFTHGPIPAGLFVCHRCDNKPCVNPDHLFLGTPHENALDMAAKGRSTRGERNPQARLTSDQVRDIRALAASGKTTTELAEMFTVCKSSVRKIVAGTTWKHLLEVAA
jgi:hypothetical protein